MTRPAYHTDKRHLLFDLLLACLGALFLGLVGRSFVIQLYTLRDQSMSSTFIAGDHVLANKAIYGGRWPWPEFKISGYRMPRMGDLITFEHPEGGLSLKRIVAQSGDTLAIAQKRLIVNGSLVSSPNVKASKQGDLGSEINPTGFDPKENFASISVPTPGDTLWLGRLRNRDFEFAAKLYRQQYHPGRWYISNRFIVDGETQSKQALIQNFKLDWDALKKNDFDSLNWIELQSIQNYLLSAYPASEVILLRQLQVEGKNLPSFIVRETCYFVLGDNRDESYDSRYWGFLSRSQVLAKPSLIVWSNRPNHWLGINFRRILRMVD